MEWEFRKCLESFQAYKNIRSMKDQIECNKPDVAKCLIREVQIIVSDPSQKIISKVLALRFVKEVMMFGKQEVINIVQKLLPQLVIICSHRMGDHQIERGQTFFQNHPQYIRGTSQSKKEIQTLGSTYLTLALQSVYTWAKWIPIDPNGHESLYTKAYNSLLERDVIFPTKFYYYKPSDKQKFDMVYKIEFFEDSMQNSSRMSSKKQSQMVFLQQQTYKFQTIDQIKQYIQKLSFYQNRIDNEKLQSINKYLKNYKRTINKQQNKWINNFLESYQKLNKKQIKYENFVRKLNAQQVKLQSQLQQYSEIKVKNQIGYRKINNNQNKQFNKYNSGNKVQSSKSNSFMKNQSFKLKNINDQKNTHDQLVNYYQNRIKMMLEQFQKDPTVQNIYQQNKVLNQQLRLCNIKTQQIKKILQKQITYQQEQNKMMQNKIKQLSSENLKLTNLISSQQNQQKPDNQRIIMIENQLQKQKYKYVMQQEKVKKLQKQIQKLQEQLKIYKTQIQSERNKYQQQQNKYKKQIQTSRIQINKIKENYLSLQTKYDQKLISQIKVKRAIHLQGSNFGNNDEIISERNSSSNKKQKIPINTFNKSNFTYQNFSKCLRKQLKYNNYDYILKNFHQDDKQLFIRFCRCGIKRKDILLKTNQLQIGLISELNGPKIKFVLHLTNVSDDQIDQINIDLSEDLKTQTQLSQIFIFSIQPRQQQKVLVFGNWKENQSAPLINLTYEKKQQTITKKIIMPIITIKMINNCKKWDFPRQKCYQTIQFRYTKKMLPKSTYIMSYFQNMVQSISNELYQVGLQFTPQNLLMNLKFEFKSEGMMKISLFFNQKYPEPQKIMDDILAFLQLSFSK